MGGDGQTVKPSCASVPRVFRDPIVNMVSHQKDHFTDAPWFMMEVCPNKTLLSGKCIQDYTVNMGCLPWWVRMACCCCPTLQESIIPHVSLAQEKIKLQNSKFGFCWMDIDFWTFVKEEKFAGRAILSWRRLVLWLGVVCFACRVHQPILSIQTNGQIVPLGIDRWAFKMSY